MDPPTKPKWKGLPSVARSVLIPGVIFVVLSLWLVAAWRMGRESARRATCLNNLERMVLGLGQYAQEHEGAFPWRLGAADRTDAWRDLGLLFPDYGSDSKLFYCPSSGDRSAETERTFFRRVRDTRQRGGAELSPIPGGNSRVVISYSYSYNATGKSQDAGIAPRPWLAALSSSIRVLADKKAGQPMDRRHGHMAVKGKPQGRNVAYSDGHVGWKPGAGPLDPDEGDNEVGAPDALDYTAWWSDPPYYGE
jgi:prepilin-type processing-associated H-X9-DG protein